MNIRHVHARAVPFAVLLSMASSLTAEPNHPTKFSPATAQRSDVKSALDWIDSHFDAQVSEWIKITEIPAPSGQESDRAAYIKTELAKLGYAPTTDQSGNVMVRRRGTGGGPTLVFAAHMDTVFPRSTDIRVTR